MENTKHTPGPWAFVTHLTGITIRATEFPIAEVSEKYRLPEVTEANAKLIAAAPDMLEALVDLNEAIDAYWNGKKTDAQVKKICAVQRRCFEIITKATT